MLYKSVSVILDSPGILKRERNRLSRAIEQRNPATIIRCYPVSHSGALDRIAMVLKFKNRQVYEEAILRLLREGDKDILQYVRRLLGGLSERILPGDI